jgi:hypothetical protein
VDLLNTRQALFDTLQLGSSEPEEAVIPIRSS